MFKQVSLVLLFFLILSASAFSLDYWSNNEGFWINQPSNDTSQTHLIINSSQLSDTSNCTGVFGYDCSFDTLGGFTVNNDSGRITLSGGKLILTNPAQTDVWSICADIPAHASNAFEIYADITNTSIYSTRSSVGFMVSEEGSTLNAAEVALRDTGSWMVYGSASLPADAYIYAINSVAAASTTDVMATNFTHFIMNYSGADNQLRLYDNTDTVVQSELAGTQSTDASSIDTFCIAPYGAGPGTSTTDYEIDNVIVVPNYGQTITTTCGNITATSHQCNLTIDMNITDLPIFISYKDIGLIGSNLSVGLFGGSTPPAGGGNLTVTLNSPTHLSTLYDRQVTFNYSVGMNVSPKATNCSLYLDTINIFNDTTTINASFINDFNTTFGTHTWNAFCYQNATLNGTSGEFNFTVSRSLDTDLLLPVEAGTSYNKTINASYEIAANDNATCNFYFDGIHIYTDTNNHIVTGIQNTTFSHIFSTVYGEHNWSAYCELDSETAINTTTDTRNYSIILGVTLLSPDNGVTLAGNSTNFKYSTVNLYPIICNISLDATNIDEQTPTSSGTRSYLSAVSNGGHIWHVKCYGADNLDYYVQTPSRTFNMNFENYTYLVELTSGPMNVLDDPQALFYDIDGFLNALYFEDESPTDIFWVKTVNDSTLLGSYNVTLNKTKSFFLAIRNPTNTSLITFGEDNVTEYIIDLNPTGYVGSLISQATIFNVTNNEEFDPYTYAVTKQYDTISYVADSYYLFMLPTEQGTFIIRKNITSNTLQNLGPVNDNCDIAWNTMANNQELTTWYYAAPEDIAANNYISIYSYNGTGSTEVKQFDTDLYTKAKVEGITIVFEEYEGATYVLMTNATDNAAAAQDRIYLIEEDATYEFGQTLEVPSHFFFIDEHTFVFFDLRGVTTYAYTCYFNGATLDCSEFTAAEYGLTVPYERGPMTTAKRTDENYDEVSKGAIVSSDVVQLHYNQNIYNTKFICYDEQNEYRQQFKPRILSDTNAILASTYLWGYVLPGAEIGSGIKKAYNLGENGTLRLYLVGLDWGWDLDFYSLNETQGEYYTFTIKNQFNTPLESVKVSAYRFSVVKNAFVVIEQGISDSTGAVTFFLEPFTPYRIVSEKDGYLISTFDFVPTSTTDIQILLDQEETGIIPMPSYESIWNDVSYNFTPGGGFFNDSVQFNFSCYSSGAALEFFGMNIWLVTNGTTTLYYTNNITTQPSGGAFQVWLNKTENRTKRYVIDFWFKHQNYSNFEPDIPPTITIGERRGLSLVSRLFAGGNLMSPFLFYLIAIVVAMLVGGFVSQYTVEGAGLSSLAVLWIFTLLWLDAVIVAEPEITSLMATSLATLMVGAALVIKHYV